MVTKDSFPISFNHHSRHYTGTVTPLDKDENGKARHFRVDLVEYGTIHLTMADVGGSWYSPEFQNQAFVNDIGLHIAEWYK
jgi:hypothetical protein